MDDSETRVMDAEQHRTEPGGPSVTQASADVALPQETIPGEEERPGYRQQRTVPYGALAEERARRKELQRELQNAVESRQRLQGQLDLLQELAHQRGAPGASAGGEAAPESTDDPRRDAPPDESSMPTPKAQAEERFRTQLMQSVRDVMRERPDFLAAYQHARQARVSELCALGYAPQEALAIAFDNEAEVIGNAFANGRNPAQVIYDYAQRHGYQGRAMHRAGSQPPRTVAVMSEADKVMLAARGQAASKSLSNAGGGATGTLTLEALAGMSDEEFAEATRGDRWQKLLR